MNRENSGLMNEPPDIAAEFKNVINTFFQLEAAEELDVSTGGGVLDWRRCGLKTRMSFGQMSLPYENTEAWEFPDFYGRDKRLPFDVSFISDSVLRLRLSAGPELPERDSPSEILEPFTETKWHTDETEDGWEFSSPLGKLVIGRGGGGITICDGEGKRLTGILFAGDGSGLVSGLSQPTSIARRAEDLSRCMAVSLSLGAADSIIGCGESFTALNKRGQELRLWTCDPKGVMGRDMYKPVPFFINSGGWGLFVNTSSGALFDLGRTHSGTATLYLDDVAADLFFFIGEPKRILRDYTALTGRSPVPPLWSFGLWMSRCSYRTAEEVLEVAEKMRSMEIPVDVLHIDTGWFEKEWRCDMEFSPTRFPEPKELTKRLLDMDIRTSLWILPYFAPCNPLFKEIVDKGYAVKDADGLLPGEDAVLDLSNEHAVEWFRSKLRELQKKGAAVFKTDFGEAAPLKGVYASGAGGGKEHNLYPLRYQKAVFEASEGGEGCIWARAGWAGAQRYPVHWGGDSESTDNGMAASLRGGLSIGASGFVFWSHDIGGFFKQCSEDLYLRWLAFGMFSSHSRCHGQVPKEPWTLSESGADMFKKLVELRYCLMPYIYTQAALAARSGLPMLRALCIEFPGDPVAWKTEDEYLFGGRMLVAPLMEEGAAERYVYLPEGEWVNYFTGEIYAGGRGHTVKASAYPIVVMVRSGSLLPHAKLARSVMRMDWGSVTMRRFIGTAAAAEGELWVPGEDEPRIIKEDYRQNDK